MPPSVSSIENLPLYNSTTSDPSMAGLLMYEKKYGSYYSYDGGQWNSELPKPDFKANKSRFLATKDEEQVVSCGGILITFCGHHQALQFSAPVDGVQSYNNLNIEREPVTIKYGAINYTFHNSKFIIQEPILFNIPSKTVGVLALTEGPQYSKS
ncbi:hypothetical protein [Elizabethkingia sp. JS20170427COW]|uniref:hypothetical protein n=1 Tax=Elizabethkingia sp. JS20170427COW TaxID=2583851 RepID=UPI001110D199|nr:hypothetical protein [Elizabethkingia sp. JS20170427COW]QCX52782.1 hypothetical protein FGE20_03000 [Elizabethkingia sp. JS20170427COW]